MLPRKEHPRPSMFRENWSNLNGEWDFYIDFSNTGKERQIYKGIGFDRKIIVPFCPESELSGVDYKDFMPAVWYKKIINITSNNLQNRVIIHFGAVDYKSELFINEKSVGVHKGGYSSFEYDITDYLVTGENLIVISAIDDIKSGKQPSGKQSDEFSSYGCCYTRTTGIWQTVWLEFLPKKYIKNYKIITDPDNKKVDICITTAGDLCKDQLSVSAFFEGEEMGFSTVETTGDTANITLSLNEVHLWDIGQGNLYDLKISLSSGDTVNSYFGLRTIQWHNKAMYLNGRIVFQRLILDQGFYPDGIYTAPSDEALKNDIILSMNLGFNGARMHEKVFEERYIYHADKLGYLTWGEMANWGLDITTAQGLENFLPEWLEVI